MTSKKFLLNTVLQKPYSFTHILCYEKRILFFILRIELHTKTF